MLAIRLQRRGRKGLAQFRVIVQDSHRSPKSGRVVAHLGSYDPHSKALEIDNEKASFYLSNGAQPSDRVVRLFKSENIKLPKWVEDPTKKAASVRNPEKLRKNVPKEEEVKEETPAEEAKTETVEETPADDTKDSSEEVKEEKKEDKKEDKKEA